MRAVCLVLVLMVAALQVACSGAENANEKAATVAPAGSGNASEKAAAAPQAPAIAAIDGARIINADSEPGNWLAHGRTYGEQRFSPLDQINVGNVKQLGLAWYFDTDIDRGMEASPIVVDGVMYTTGAWSIVYALDAKSGKLLWKYDPKVNRERGVMGCCDVVNRGVAVWKGRVYLGSFDGRLIALDAGDGSVVWDVLTVDLDRPYTITGAPRIVKDKVIIGNGGAELGVRGYVSAYDAATGALTWRFYTVPGDPAQPFETPALATAAKTWKGEWWKVGGGGTVWDSMAYDPELDLLYIGVGNGSPWSRDVRSPGGGDNLYLSSIVALRPDSGAYVWHYQTTPGDNWDYTATQHMILADLKIGDATRKVIMQAPKNGFFYVLDRATGAFISAKNYVPMNWATGVDPATGRPIENPEVADHSKAEKLTYPTMMGGHNWQPMAYSPMTGLVYIPANEAAIGYQTDPNFKAKRGWNTGTLPVKLPEDTATLREIQKAGTGKLSAWDPVAQREVWRVDYLDPGNGGVLATAGNLVFQGTIDGRIVAYSADKGERLWETNAQTGLGAPPITYALDGEQYIAISAGWGMSLSLSWGPLIASQPVASESRVLVYKLGGAAHLPDPKAPVPFPQPPALVDDENVIAKGRAVYADYCSFCHGPAVMSGGTLPDLRYMSAETHAAFDGIVLGGVLRDKGMVGFSEQLGLDDAHALHAYVIKRAHDLKNELAAGAK